MRPGARRGFDQNKLRPNTLTSGGPQRRVPTVPELERELGRKRETRNLLVTPECTAQRKQFRALKVEENNLKLQIGGLLKTNEELGFKCKPHREDLQKAVVDIPEARLEVEASRVRFEARPPC